MPTLYTSLKSLLIIALCSLTLSLHAQNTIRGSVTDAATGTPVAGAIVTLADLQNNTIGYANTNQNGLYVISSPAAMPKAGAALQVSCLGYSQRSQAFTAGRFTYNFSLSPAVTELHEVKIKARANIYQGKDTLRYSVNSFRKAEDRTIGDVLKRMPGIEISENGQISFNGKPIYNLYVGGDDLMDGRYNLGTRTIKKDIIQSVEVLQNFQPLKVLKNKAASSQVALNLVIKKGAALQLSGEIKAAAGLPKQYDAEANTILLNKKIKMLNTLMANNSGRNYNSDAERLALPEEYGISAEGHAVPPLSLGLAGAPALPPQLYHINRSGALNLNNVYTLKGGLQLKAHVQAIADRNTMDYAGYSLYYYGYDTIRYTAAQSAVNYPAAVNATIKLEANKDKYYLRNDLRYTYNRNNDAAAMLYNGAGFNQRLKGDEYILSNSLQYTPAIKSSAYINIAWNISLNKYPQALQVDSGIYSSQLNNGLPYRAYRQLASLPMAESNARAEYNISRGPLRYYATLAMLNQWAGFNSSAYLYRADSTVNQRAGNDVTWHNNRLAAGAGIAYAAGRWDINLRLPATLQLINYRPGVDSAYTNRNDVYLAPSGRIKYTTGISGSYLEYFFYNTRNYSDITGIYPQEVLVNYNTLISSAAPLQVSTITGNTLRYNFQQPVSMLFFNISGTYVHTAANSMPVINISEQGQQLEMQAMRNTSARYGIKAGVGKYLFFLKANSELNAGWSMNTYTQLINGAAARFGNTAYTISGKLGTRIKNRIDLAYRFNSTFNATKQLEPAAAGSRHFSRLDQSLTADWQPVKNLYSNASARWIHNAGPGINTPAYTFIDAGLRYRSVKLKTDFELELQNLANVKRYTTQAITANTYSNYTYTLRGRMALLRVTFNF